MILVKNRFSVFAKCVNPQLGSPQLNSQRFQYLSDSHHILLLTALYELLYILYTVIPWKIVQVSFISSPLSPDSHIPRYPYLPKVPLLFLASTHPSVHSNPLPSGSFSSTGLYLPLSHQESSLISSLSTPPSTEITQTPLFLHMILLRHPLLVLQHTLPILTLLLIFKAVCMG